MLYKFVLQFSSPSDVIAVTESKLKINDQLQQLHIEIPGYHFCHVPTNSNAEGVGVYISTKYAFESLNAFGLNHSDCEDIWLQLTKKQMRSTLGNRSCIQTPKK